jgi:hypothetical protein
VTRQHAIDLARKHNLMRVITPTLVIVWWPNGTVFRHYAEWPTIPVTHDRPS